MWLQIFDDIGMKSSFAGNDTSMLFMNSTESDFCERAVIGSDLFVFLR